MINYTATLFIIISLACQGPIPLLEFHSGKVDRSFSPIYFSSDININEESKYYLENIQNGKKYPVQIISDNEWVTIFDDFPANTIMRLELKEGDHTNYLYPQVSIEESSEGILGKVDGKPLLFYQIETTGPEDNHPEYYNRSGFIHPLYSPNGEILTDDFPKGHTHQNAIFKAWTNTTFKGTKVDFWNRQEELGTIIHSETMKVNRGLLIGQFTTKLSHVSLKHGEVLEEEWHISIYPTDKYFLFDLKSVQVNTSQDTLFLAEYLYGGMAFRGSKEWNKDDTDHFTNTWEILTSKGLTAESANHTKAEWVNASGRINGNRAGLAVFSFPDNFRAPQMIRIHPEMPYWVYSPVVEGAFYIAPGQKYVSRYRYLSHDGTIDTAELNRVHADLENPPVVKQIE